MIVQLIYICFSLSYVTASVDTNYFGLLYDYASSVDFSCGANPRDSSSYSCGSCGSGQEVNPNTFDGDANYYGCRCQAGFEQSLNDCSNDDSGNCVSLVCTSCIEKGSASYSDRSGCVACDSTTLGLSSTGDCSCSAGQVLVESNMTDIKLSSKSCYTCAEGTATVTVAQTIAGRYYDADQYTCVSCPDSFMSMSVTESNIYSCTCASSYTLVGVSGIGSQSCLLTSLANTYKASVTAASKVTYYDTDAAGTITSLTMEHYFLQAASKCQYFGAPDDVRYCQILANLCVLQLYDVLAEACIAHLAIIAARGQNGVDVINNIDNWVVGQPWLYFAGTDANTICTTNIYKQRVSLKESVVRYVLATYHMNGTFLGYQDLGTSLSYCKRNAPYSDLGGGDSSSTSWRFFGNNLKYSFSCDLNELLISQQEQLFYELFLYSAKANNYVALPIRITNILSGGVQPNNKVTSVPLCDSTDVLVRRFFLFDRSSGITTAPDTTSTTSAIPEVMRYATYISIETSLVTTEFARIYAPVVTIQYKEVKPSSWGTTHTASNSIVSVEFFAFYTMDLTTFNSDFKTFFIVIMVLTGLLFALRYHNWSARNSRVVAATTMNTDLGGFNVSTLMELIMIAMDTWNIVFFPVTLCITWYLFAFFKIPSVPSVLLPPEINTYSSSSPYFMFIVNVHVMACFQLVHVLLMIKRQCTADLFFIDWEPNRLTKNNSNKGSSSSSSGHHLPSHQVSVWRTILVANEWTELQTIRKTDIRFTLLFLGFILLGLGEEYNATQQPNVSDKSAGHLNMLLRFGNTMFFWILISYAQYCWKFFIAERYLGEPPERLFVDFCTIAKISVIVMDEKYHGYYLHCRSPHQYADGTMSELVQMLRQEEAGLTIDRSLEGAPPDVQTFQIFVSAEWRAAFDKINVSLTGAENNMAQLLNESRNRAVTRAAAAKNNNNNHNGNNSNNNGNNRSRIAVNNAPSPHVLKAWKEMLLFLQEFVENNFGQTGLRRIVRDPTYWEKQTNGAPELTAPDQPSMFFTDREYNYCKVWFLGREADLLLLNMLLYAMFDLWFSSTVITMFLTYLVEILIVHLRHSWGQAMISKKTLIDSRFLI